MLHGRAVIPDATQPGWTFSGGEDSDGRGPERESPTSPGDGGGKFVPMLLIQPAESLQAAAPLAVLAVETGDEDMALAMKRQAYVSNLPPVGHKDNYVSPTMQFNVSPTQPADAVACKFCLHPAVR